MCKIITMSELQNCTDSELSALFCKVSQDVAQSKPGSSQRRNALASRENINRAIVSRRTFYPKPPGC